MNGDPIEPRVLGETFVDDTGNPLDVSEVTLGDRSFRHLDDPNVSFPSPVDTVTVEPGRYFMLGDNRDHLEGQPLLGQRAAARRSRARLHPLLVVGLQRTAGASC